MRCEIAPIARFGQMASDWDHLASRYRGAPFMQSLFVRELIRHFASAQARIISLRDDAGPCAIGIFERRRGMWQTLQPSQAPLGLLVTRADMPTAEVLRAIGGRAGLTALGVAASQQDPLYCS